MAKQPVKQITLMVHSAEYPDILMRSREEGELLAYTDNVGKPPENLEPSHPAYKLWTYKTARDGAVLDLIREAEEASLRKI